jgi:hypothetical protein
MLKLKNLTFDFKKSIFFNNLIKRKLQSSKQEQQNHSTQFFNQYLILKYITLLHAIRFMDN